MLDDFHKDYTYKSFQGLEDHLVEMDFKIAGTRNGITAIQLDVKSVGISLDIICEALSYGGQARLQILDHMERVINSPKETCRYKKRDDWKLLNWFMGLTILVSLD